VLVYFRGKSGTVEYFAIPERVLWVALLVAQGVLCLKLASENLTWRYPFFTAYLASEVLSGLVLIQIPFHSRGYAEVFSVYAFLIAGLRVGVALELLYRIFAHFQSGKIFTTALATAALGISGVVALLTFRGNPEWSWPQTLAMVLRQFQGEILGAAFLLLWLVLRYAMKVDRFLSPNVLRHWRLSTAYFAATGLNALAILASGGGRAVHPINTALLAVDLACSLLWLRLTEAGECELQFPKFSPEEIKLIEEREQEFHEAVRSLPGKIAGRPKRS